jgi:uncharacterized SAM-binding protein YcdF (DUF218 family)
MDFLLKKIISAILLPVPVIVLLLLLAGVLFIFQKKTIELIISVGAVLLIVVFSTAPIPNYLLSSLEKKYPPLLHVPKGVQKIVVLGGGNGGGSRLPPNIKLSASSLSRLVEAIRIHHNVPGSELILSGGRVFGSPSDAKIMNSTAAILGVAPSNIKIEAGSQDTYQEAQYIKRFVGAKPFILVTSAFHMPRAMALFKGQGMHPIAAPTQYIIKGPQYAARRYVPNSFNLTKTGIAFHEYLGLLWAKLHGRISSLP